MNIDELITMLKEANDNLNNIKQIKREIESQILSLIDYNKDGSKTLETLLTKQRYVVKAGNTLNLNEKIAEEYKECFPGDTFPVVSTTTYKVDAKKYKQLQAYPDLMEMVDKFIKPVPKSVSIEVL